MGFQSQTIVVVQCGRPGRVCSDVALVDDDGCEEEEMQLGQLLTNAPPFAQREDEHTAGQVLVQCSVLVQETQRVKGLRVGPHCRVVVDGPLVDEDDCVLWYGVAHDGGVSGSGVGDGERQKAREAHHLIDEGHDIRQLQLVLDGREPAAVHHLVHLLLETHLHLWILDKYDGDPLHGS